MLFPLPRQEAFYFLARIANHSLLLVGVIEFFLFTEKIRPERANRTRLSDRDGLSPDCAGTQSIVPTFRGPGCPSRRPSARQNQAASSLPKPLSCIARSWPPELLRAGRSPCG